MKYHLFCLYPVKWESFIIENEIYRHAFSNMIYFGAALQINWFWFCMLNYSFEEFVNFGRLRPRIRSTAKITPNEIPYQLDVLLENMTIRYSQKCFHWSISRRNNVLSSRIATILDTSAHPATW